MQINTPSSVSGQTPGRPGGGLTTTDSTPGSTQALHIIQQWSADQAQAVTRINAQYSPAIITTSTDTFPAVVNEIGKIAKY